MKIMVVGSGAREHAIASKLLEDKRVEKVYIASGNAVDRLDSRIENINAYEIEELIKASKENKVDLTIVGSEELLVSGIVDSFKKENLNIFGPDKKAAMLEGSKAFSKEFMNKYGVKTARSKSFDDINEAIKYVENMPHPLVIKASGLALGKGVVISENIKMSKDTIIDMMENKKFGEAGTRIVIEEFLEGVEVSVLSITDSNTILPFISAKDHKKVFEGEKGPNTGGMGVIAPNPYFTKDYQNMFITDILNPTLKGIKKENMDFSGIIFFGLMLTKNGAYLLEYNMRLGDPETQAVLPLMKSNLLDLIISANDKKLGEFNLEWSNKSSCCIVLASGGYPNKYEKNYEISGIENFIVDENNKVYLAGVKYENDKFLTNGGRVLNVVAIRDNLEAAKHDAYKLVDKINFKDKHFRKDIGNYKG
ncbi:phosphoribosylamine--glycine ligase [Oceanivirga miroungae]|uniref:Phosphoribosylamine--glycine ligase n=1 Tax=Oceanivirga miroungae TaxID=1130046 RepID=A0A6I8ME81_9FUSO|nr:phosphoribosylamine--glycine ligase [Oceanivirga miroungae]VWL85517.1 phosphoribosylamine-glycine ligase [Oceanivirga miroungae]